MGKKIGGGPKVNLPTLFQNLLAPLGAGIIRKLRNRDMSPKEANNN